MSRLLRIDSRFLYQSFFSRRFSRARFDQAQGMDKFKQLLQELKVQHKETKIGSKVKINKSQPLVAPTIKKQATSQKRVFKSMKAFGSNFSNQAKKAPIKRVVRTVIKLEDRCTAMLAAVTDEERDLKAAEFFGAMIALSPRHHSTALFKKLQTRPDLIIQYLEFFYGGRRVNFTHSEAAVIKVVELTMTAYEFLPMEAAEQMKNVIAHFNAKDYRDVISPSFVTKLFQTVVHSAKYKDSSIYMMKVLKDLEPFVAAAKPELRAYLMKWTYLSSLDILEMILDTPRYSLLCSNLQCTKVKNAKAGSTYQAKMKNSPQEWRSGTLICLRNMDMRHFATLNYYDGGERTMVMHNEVGFDENLTYEAFVVGPLSTYTASLEALTKLVKKGPACTGAYEYFMGNLPVPLAEPLSTQLISVLRDRNLNMSQMEAIAGVMNQPVSLIQGPPGTGKTHTIAELVNVLSRHMKARILVVTPTNAAADNVMGFALRAGLNALRTGDYESTREDMKRHTLASKVYKPIQNYSQSMAVIKYANVVVTTAASAGFALLEKAEFDYLIIDEASQLTEPIALIPITNGIKHIVLVGDHKQLPPNVGFLSSIEGFGESLFSRLSASITPFLLKVQYRSHPLIMSISSKLFYDNELEHGVQESERQPPKGFPWPRGKNKSLLPVAFVPSHHAESPNESSKSNRDEAVVVVNIVQKLIAAGVNERDIGVISPYSGQNKILKMMLGKARIGGIELNSVDAFQGREKEVIVFSATRSNRNGNLGFLADPRRFNVMHTRAKRGLIVVGNRETLMHNTTWASWFDWVDLHGLTVKA